MPGPGWLSRGVAFALGAERAAGLVGVDVCSWSDSRSVECRGGCLRREAEKSCWYGSVWRDVFRWCELAISVAERRPDQS